MSTAAPDRVTIRSRRGPGITVETCAIDGVPAVRFVFYGDQRVYCILDSDQWSRLVGAVSRVLAPPETSYAWMVERARSGEPVAIDTDRPDINDVIDFLAKIDGHGLTIQDDGAAGLLWLSRSITQEGEGR